MQAIVGLQLVLTAVCLGLAAPSCLAAEDVTQFKRPEDVNGSRQAGAVPLEHSFGGLYAYSAPSAAPTASTASAAAPASRLVIGPRPISQFVLLSAEEEAAMWSLRERQRSAVTSTSASALASLGASYRRRHRQAGTAGASACTNVPRVVESEDKTCVPDLAHASAPDWREHLVCWVKQLRVVEVKHD